MATQVTILKRLKYILLLFGALAFLQINEPEKLRYVYPGLTWTYIKNPAEAGWDAAKLSALKTFITDSCNTSGMMVIHRGKVLFEYGDSKELSYIASCRKSVLAMLYGPFVENGKINLMATVGDLGLDDIRGLLPIEKQATIKDLLTARSGVYHPASNPGDATSLAPGRGTVAPGTCWLYNNWDFNIAGYILEQKTKRSVYELVDSILARPLQMQDWDINAQEKSGDTSRSKYMAYHMWFSTEDMARIGYLMLREGKWKNKQLIPAQWIRTITSTVTTYWEALANKTNFLYFGYGYMWWRWERPYTSGPYAGWYTAIGAYGQYITVFPTLDLVVAHKNKSMELETSLELYLKLLDRIISARPT